MKIVKFFPGLLVIGAFTMFATANLQKVQVNLFAENQPILGSVTVEKTDAAGKVIEETRPRQVPLFVLIYATFLFGFLVAWFLSIGLVRKHKKAAKKLTKQSNSMAKELNELRNLPVQDPASSKTKSLPESTGDSEALPVE